MVDPFWLGFLGVITILSGVAIYLSISTRRLFRRLSSVTKEDGFDRALSKLLIHFEESRRLLESLRERLDEEERRSQSHFQKIGFVRFNPFPDTGGDQSFTLSLLDRQDRGFVISSLHSREQTRIYAKLVSSETGDGLKFSKEERRAIEQAKKEPSPALITKKTHS